MAERHGWSMAEILSDDIDSAACLFVALRVEQVARVQDNQLCALDALLTARTDIPSGTWFRHAAGLSGAWSPGIWSFRQNAADLHASARHTSARLRAAALKARTACNLP
jgi:hypothetical protein